MLGQRLRRWANIKPVFGQHLVCVHTWQRDREHEDMWGISDRGREHEDVASMDCDGYKPN